MSDQTLTVLQLNEYLKAKLDADPMLGAVAVKGELSNYKVYPSGHHYFTLKDAESSLRCVMFRGNAMRLRFRPDNGMQVIVMGKISVYPRDGGYQLYCNNIVPDGAGDLHTAFYRTVLNAQQKNVFRHNGNTANAGFLNGHFLIHSLTPSVYCFMISCFSTTYLLNAIATSKMIIDIPARSCWA